MPFLLKPNQDISELADYESVLIVPCRFCPAASSAVKNKLPYIELFRNFLKTDAYEKQIDNLKSRLTKRGVRAGVFKSRWIHQFVLCMWTSRRRKALKRRADKYDALVVLGCEAAVKTVRNAVEIPSHKVHQGLETEGVMSIKPRFQLPSTLSLELESLTRLVCRDEPSKEACC